jgi:hypothetical protein
MRWEVSPDHMQICLMSKTKVAFVLEPRCGAKGSFDVYAYPLVMEQQERGKHLGFAFGENAAKKLCYDHVFTARKRKENQVAN